VLAVGIGLAVGFGHGVARPICLWAGRSGGTACRVVG
jgi:hypothetical protein